MHRSLHVLIVSVSLSTIVCVGACRPLLDGGWDGTAQCDGTTFPLSAIFNEDGDGELDGTVYIEGIFGGFGGIVKGVIENGERDPDDGSYSFDLQSDGDDAPDFDVEMEYSDDQAEELDGTVDILDDDGAPDETCELELELVSVSD